MKKVSILLVIFLPILCFSQNDSVNRPEYFIGFTPFKPWISSGIGVSFHKKKTDNLYFGIESIIYTPMEGALNRLPNGFKIYGNVRAYFFEQNAFRIYSQFNVGGGYFYHDVTYTTEYYEPLQEDYYAIDIFKRYAALGGGVQLGYHLMFKRISFDLNVGIQILKRILDNSVEYNGVTFRRNLGVYSYPPPNINDEDIDWIIFGAGSIVNSSFTIKYNIY